MAIPRLTPDLIKTLAKEVSELVLSGVVIEDAIAQAWAKYQVPQALYESAKLASMAVIKKTLGLENVLTGVNPELAYNRLVGANPEVRDQIAKASARARYDVQKEVTKVIKQGDAVRESAVRLEEMASGSQSVIRKDIETIYTFGGNAKEIAKVRNLVTNGVKGAPLKSAYRGLLKAVEEGTPKQIEKQMEIAIMQKTRYNAERVVRTEQARARFASDREIIAESGVPFVRFVLAGGHEADECDAYATADMGYGPGIYPIDQAPSLPIHPNGKSRLIPIRMPKKETDTPISATQALLNAGTEKGVKINNIQFEPITRKL
jgi:hypothetical protein